MTSLIACAIMGILGCIMKVFVAVFVSLALTACATAPTPTPRPSHWAVAVKPDANLYQVDKNLYRSEQLNQDDKAKIHELNIKTIINLRYFDRHDDQDVFADDKITLINAPLLAWKIRPTEIAQVLHRIETQQQQGSVLVHCHHGADRTGIVIAMYRIIYQGWTVDDAKQEMLQGDYGYHNVWKNLEYLLTDFHVTQVKSELARLRLANKKG